MTSLYEIGKMCYEAYKLSIGGILKNFSDLPMNEVRAWCDAGTAVLLGVELDNDHDNGYSSSEIFINDEEYEKRKKHDGQ
jgi:hypothetical protein